MDVLMAVTGLGCIFSDSNLWSLDKDKVYFKTLCLQFNYVEFLFKFMRTAKLPVIHFEQYVNVTLRLCRFAG